MFEVSQFIAAKVKAHKLVTAAVVGYAVLVLFHIPLETFKTLFDKNQAPQFFNLLVLTSIFGIIILAKAKRIPNSKPAFILGFALLGALFLSALQSGSFYPAITGDALRYAGIASNVGLLLVALFHGLFTSQNFPTLVNSYLGVLFITEVLAVLQFFKVITLPGLQGNPTSTFGNLDFYSAYVGTSFPLILYAWLGSARLGRALSASLAVLSVICLRLVDAKQGYLDLAIALFLVATFIIYQKKRASEGEPRFSLNVRTALVSFALIIWLEFIFLVPFLGKAIPFIGDDPQVAIRGVLWLAGMNQFLSHPFLGVGPDQYGAYYEHYRTVNSTIVLPGDSSNDAHSATVQSLATTGIFGSLIFFLLIALVIRSILVILASNPADKKRTYALSLFLFIYMTNAAVSPIVLPHKYLFWGISGYLIFQAARVTQVVDDQKKEPRLLQASVVLLTAGALMVGSGFLASQYNFAKWGEARRIDANARPSVHVSKLLPCHIYFTYLAGILSPQGDATIERFTREQIKISPRCYEAQRMLAALAYNKGDLKEMKKRVDILIDLAPAQREVLDIANLYAVKAGDKELEKKVEQQLARMGVYTVQVG